MRSGNLDRINTIKHVLCSVDITINTNSIANFNGVKENIVGKPIT